MAARFLGSAAKDGRYVIFAFKDERTNKSKYKRPVRSRVTGRLFQKTPAKYGRSSRG
ncbi:hypothetical protein [Rudaea sp.]|jgi:hypothetical protein|uniref:hypothetical protein n=1 Tax=Rudaea sp. TaxID=2136325 RepID=UPI002F91CFFD